MISLTRCDITQACGEDNVLLKPRVTIHPPARSGLKQGPDLAIHEVASNVLELRACRMQIASSTSKPRTRHYVPRWPRKPVRSSV